MNRIERLKEEYKSAAETNDVRYLLSELDIAVEALKWYGDKRNHRIGYNETEQTPFAAIDEDSGAIARNALHRFDRNR